MTQLLFLDLVVSSLSFLKFLCLGFFKCSFIKILLDWLFISHCPGENKLKPCTQKGVSKKLTIIHSLFLNISNPQNLNFSTKTRRDINYFLANRLGYRYLPKCFNFLQNAILYNKLYCLINLTFHHQTSRYVCLPNTHLDQSNTHFSELVTLRHKLTSSICL